MKNMIRYGPQIWTAAVLAIVMAVSGGCRDAETAAHGGADQAAQLEAQGDNEHEGNDHAAESGQAAHAAGADAAIPLSLSSYADWCAGHGVPESLCTRCNSALIDEFKARGDWCGGHGLPESQCLLCNPGFKAKWEALRPKPSPAAAPAATTAAEDDIRVEARPRLVTGDNDPLCQVDRLQIRFRDKTIVEKAGIRVEPVKLRRISATIECPGEITFDQTRLAHITARVPGFIHEVPVALGQSVGVGELLAVIESPGLGEAKSRYITLRENYLLAKADFDRVHAISTATQRVLQTCESAATADDTRKHLAGVRIGDAKGRLLKAHAGLELAQANFERETRMRDRGISSDQAFEGARSQLHAADAEFHATHEAIALASERDNLAAERDLKVARSAVDAAKRRLVVLGLTQTQIDAIATGSDEQLTRYELRSPTAGEVVQRQAVVGEAADEKRVLFTVVDQSSVWLMLDFQERELVALQPGLPVIFTLDGLGGRSFEGRIDWISREVDPRTRTVKARVNLPNPSGLLRANMFGSARVVLHDNDEVPTVPMSAIQADGCCQIAFVKHADDLFKPRKVQLGSNSSGYVEILEGLESGEQVVTTGSFLMKTEILKANIGAGCCEVDPGR